MSILTDRRASISLMLSTLLLGACGDGAVLSWKPETPAERELRLSKERLQSTVGQGGLAGAGAGAAIGALLGGPVGAFRGAELGRFAGAAAGAYVRQLQADFATQEAVLNRVITDLQLTNQRLEESIAAMNGVLAETRAAAEADQTRLARNAAEAAGAVEAAERQEAFFGSTRAILIEDVSSASGAALDPELARLSRRIATMRGIAAQLANET